MALLVLVSEGRRSTCPIPEWKASGALSYAKGSDTTVGSSRQVCVVILDE